MLCGVLIYSGSTCPRAFRFHSIASCFFPYDALWITERLSFSVVSSELQLTLVRLPEASSLVSKKGHFVFRCPKKRHELFSSFWREKQRLPRCLTSPCLQYDCQNPVFVVSVSVNFQFFRRGSPLYEVKINRI